MFAMMRTPLLAHGLIADAAYWGYGISPEERSFAHRLVDTSVVDIVHGHSSHHAKAMEVYKGKLILYSCGDFLNDYEGIAGYEAYRDELALMYLLAIEAVTGNLLRLSIVPFRIKRFRLHCASLSDVMWIRDVLTREGHAFGTRLDLMQETRLEVSWT